MISAQHELVIILQSLQLVPKPKGTTRVREEQPQCLSLCLSIADFLCLSLSLSASLLPDLSRAHTQDPSQ